MTQPLTGRPTGAPVGVPSLHGMAGEANARDEFRRRQQQEEEARTPRHKCGQCYGPLGWSSIRCPNDDTPPPAPAIDFDIPHDFGCPGCKEQRIVAAADDARIDRENEEMELMAA